MNEEFYPIELIVLVCFRIDDGIYVRIEKQGEKITTPTVHRLVSPHDVIDRSSFFVDAQDQEMINDVLSSLAKRGYKDDKVTLELHQTWK